MCDGGIHLLTLFLCPRSGKFPRSFEKFEGSSDLARDPQDPDKPYSHAFFAEHMKRGQEVDL